MDEFKKHIQQNIHLINDDEPSPQVWNKIKSSIHNEKNIAPLVNINTTKNNIFNLLKYAVAACIIGLAAVGVFHLTNNNTAKSDNNIVSNQPPKTIENIVKNDTQQNIVETDTPIAVLQTVAKTFIKAVTHNIINDDTMNAFIGSSKPNDDENFVQVKSIDSQFNNVIALQKNVINNTPIFAENVTYFNGFVHDFKQMEKDEKQVKKDIAKMGFNNELLSQLINVYQQKLDLLKTFQTEINKTNIRFKQNRNLIDSSKMYYITI